MIKMPSATVMDPQSLPSILSSKMWLVNDWTWVNMMWLNSTNSINAVSISHIVFMCGFCCFYRSFMWILYQIKLLLLVFVKFLNRNIWCKGDHRKHVMNISCNNLILPQTLALQIRPSLSLITVVLMMNLCVRWAFVLLLIMAGREWSQWVASMWMTTHTWAKNKMVRSVTVSLWMWSLCFWQCVLIHRKKL